MIWTRHWTKCSIATDRLAHSSLNWVESMLIIIKMKITIMFVVAVCANVRLYVGLCHAIYLSCPVEFVHFFSHSIDWPL